MSHWAWKIVGVAAAVLMLGSCGGGGGGGGGGGFNEDGFGVISGFSGDFNWSCDTCGEAGGEGGVGAGGDGEGGVGAGGDFGQFRNADLYVFFPDGEELGHAKTDATNGMVTIRPGRNGEPYQGPLILELRGGDGATYYEEGKDAFVSFPAGEVIRAVVPFIDKNIGITPFSEAAYRRVAASVGSAAPTAEDIQAANEAVRDILNQQFPAALSVDDVTRLPFIKSPSIAEGSIDIDPRGRYGLVNGAFSKQAAMFNAGRERPTLDAVKQLGNDLLDGVLDGMNGSQSAASAAARTYDPHTLAGELSSALAEQSFRFGSDRAKLQLPKVLNFGNTRYQGYLFDASLTTEGEAIDTVAGWVGDNNLRRTLGQPISKLGGAGSRVFGVFANHGHGSVFFKTDAPDSASEVYAVGDNVNGELGTGDTSASASAVKITLPGVLTHIAGGFAHTVARLADGTVYAWGDNSMGQLGTGNNTSSLEPVPVNLPRGAVAVAATNTASFALLDNGDVYAWGDSGGFGLLGDGDKNSARSAPAQVTGLAGIVQITARDNDVAVLRRDGSVWHWGSFPADEDAFTEGEVDAPYRGGSAAPTQVSGLPADVAVRKILTEQGLFAALLADGTVYQWGVYFDITAGTILRDLTASRVLGLPPIRDMMPGGFIGYGVRPFDRLTAMGVDYRGGMWKIRGRVAEQYDPANPSLQRRPQGQAPRPDCASCHVFLDDFPLTPDAPTSTATCQPSPSAHMSGSVSLIHAETQCETCHNPNQRPIDSFPNGWLTCVKPSNLPPRSSPIEPDIITEACEIPLGHPFTPPGTVCASCHNSIIARPLSELVPSCAQPTSNQLPTIATSVTITGAANGSTPIAAGSSTNDTTPTLSGTISAALGTGEVVKVYANGTALGNAVASGTNWSFTPSAQSQGAKTFSARVETSSSFGAWSSGFDITIDTIAPAVPAVAEISDGISGPLADGASTSDTRPTISGTVSPALVTGESVQVLRTPNGGSATLIATLTPSGTNWSHRETGALTDGTYSYQARTIDAAGNQSALGSQRTVTIDTTVPLAGAATTVATINGVTPTDNEIAVNADPTPTLEGTIQRALLAGEHIRIYQTGTSSLTAAVVPAAGSTNWSYESPALPTGNYTFLARIEQIADESVFGTPSASVLDPIDVTEPDQVATISATSSVTPNSQLAGATPASDVIVGQTNDPTPTVSIQLSAPMSDSESLEIRRNDAVISPALSSCGENCFRFTDDPGVSIPVPSTTPNASLPIGNGYTARVVDSAGNQGPQGSLTFNFDYFVCDGVRATAALSSHAAITPSLNCATSGCHQPMDVQNGVTYVPVPRTTPTYWCRRPS